MRETVVIVGVGGMGLACARRIGSGQRLVLADFNPQQLKLAADQLRGEGHDVIEQQVDVADATSMAALAEATAAAGPLRTLVHTAGLSPTMASSQRIYAVDLLGTALVMDAFLPLARAGTCAVMVASIAPCLMPTPQELEPKLALAATSELMSVVAGVFENDPYGAYALSKRGNALRVEAAASAWGAKGARVVSVSPGLILTAMQQQEAKANEQIPALRQATPVDRYGTPEDIAAAVEWLAGPNASFVSGTDLRVDGGVVAAVRWAAGSS